MAFNQEFDYHDIIHPILKILKLSFLFKFKMKFNFLHFYLFF